MAKDRISLAFEQWKKRSNGERIYAICKPCWELNYCPYGPLVEHFPILEEGDECRCRIFGHECPVFRVAEPLTETIKMRNISRHIPQAVKFKVMRRDKGVCQVCGKNVSDEEMSFDHIIPWSKGGRSDESNIRLLCRECNQRRGNDYEADNLVASIHEAYDNLYRLDLAMLEDLLRLFQVKLVIQERLEDVSAETYCRVIHEDDSETDAFMYLLISQIEDALSFETPLIKVKKKMNLLRYRWGMEDKRIHSITETCQRFRVDPAYYIEQETLLLRKIGFFLEPKSRTSSEYLSLTVDRDQVERMVSRPVENSSTLAG